MYILFYLQCLTFTTQDDYIEVLKHKIMLYHFAYDLVIF